VLEVVDVCASYGKVQILGGVAIGVGQGSVVALLGGNGTGKSTALTTIMGFIRPLSGEVWFDGVRTDGVPAKDVIVRGLALVPQGKEAFQDMTVEENILMGAYHRRREARLPEHRRRSRYGFRAACRRPFRK
jgi:branched-chain amino acid transport system ATP-binding protein